MKNSDYLLEQLKINGQVEVDYRFIEDALEFKSQFREPTINSLLLESRGHRPETSVKYDKMVFSEWCRDNKIVFVCQMMERTYLLKR